jgi:hypothetical protein
MWQFLEDVTDWFNDTSDAYKLQRDFNKAARLAFITGNAGTLIECKTTRGDSRYKHQFSSYINTGFRVKALSGKSLKSEDLKNIGRIILDNQSLVRRLVMLGWDTLEVHSDVDSHGLKWKLVEHANIGNFLN